MLPLVASCNIKSIRSEQNIRLVLKHIECSDSLKHMLSKSVSLTRIAQLMQCRHTAQIWMNASTKPHQLRERSKDPVHLRAKTSHPLMLSFQKYLLLNGVKMPFSSLRFCVTQELHKLTFTLWNGLAHNAFPMLIFMGNICKTDSNVVKHVKER